MGKTFLSYSVDRKVNLRDIERKPVPKDIPEDRKLFSTKKYVTTGQIENIEYIVYVIPEEYTNLTKREQMLEDRKDR